MKEYFAIWRNKYLTTEAQSIDDMIHMLKCAVTELEDMKASGVTLGEEGVEDDYAHLETDDPEVAKKFDMESYKEAYGEEDDEDDCCCDEDCFQGREPCGGKDD